MTGCKGEGLYFEREREYHIGEISTRAQFYRLGFENKIHRMTLVQKLFGIPAI